MKHVARIVKVDKIVNIPNRDRIQLAYVLGVGVIVSKSIKVGDLMVFFDGELRLSEEFAKENNLHRTATLNKDPNKTGYLEDNRRIRYIKMGGVQSNGLLLPLESLFFTKKKDFKEGDEFDTIGGVKICEKYISEATLKASKSLNKPKEKYKVSTPNFKEHVDTDNFFYKIDKIKKGSLISITAKLHGTSSRNTYTKVNRTNRYLLKMLHYMPFLSKILDKFKRENYEYVAGSRRVVLTEEKSEGFHGSNKYRFEILNSLKPYLNKGITIYGEIVGNVNGAAIMGTHDVTKLGNKEFESKYGKRISYNYNCSSDKYDFYIYRITLTGDDGHSLDYTSMQVEEWCARRGFKTPPLVHERFIYDGDKEKLSELVVRLTEREDCLCEDYIDPTHISEGVVIRADHVDEEPLFLKSKSFPFKLMEGIVKDKVDLEDAS